MEGSGPDSLAALITRRPACVLLDEPTNHLDDQAVAFVEDFLASLSGVVVAASHDRTFLDNVCHVIVDLDSAHFGVDGKGGNRFTGGYTDYLTAKHAARQRWEQGFLDQQDQLNELRHRAATTARQVAHNRGPTDNDKFIYQFGAANVARTISRRVRAAEKRIDLLERHRIPKPPAPLSFSGGFSGGRASAGAAVSVRDLVVEGRVRVPSLELNVGEHLLVIGANGSCKSTLLKVLNGSIAASSGSVNVSARRVGYLPQDETFAAPHRSPQQVYASLTGSQCALRSLGLLHPRDLSRPVGTLSFGQQRRLALAVLVAGEHDLLLLDEPTNHISLTLAEELEKALGAARSAVVVATHDRWLRRRWREPVLSLQPVGLADCDS